MFDLRRRHGPPTTAAGPGLWLGEVVATAGLVLTITALAEPAAPAIGWAVGAYITAAYWFTSSTSFANPAVTIARMLSDTFAGISPASVPMFLASQAVGGPPGYLSRPAPLYPAAITEGPHHHMTDTPFLRLRGPAADTSPWSTTSPTPTRVCSPATPSPPAVDDARCGSNPTPSFPTSCPSGLPVRPRAADRRRASRRPDRQARPGTAVHLRAERGPLPTRRRPGRTPVRRQDPRPLRRLRSRRPDQP